jgi:hypothetical protein
MKQSRRWQAEWAWASALVLLIVLGFWWFPGGRGGADDTFSTSAGGKRAFFTLAQRRLDSAARYLEGPLPPDDDSDTLCILGPVRYPDAREWDALHFWVGAAGNTLVFAARQHDPAVELTSFGVRVVPDQRLLDSFQDEDDDSDSSPPGPAASAEWKRLFGDPTVTTPLASGKFRWQSFGHVEAGSPDAEVLVEVDGEPQVIRQRVGQGILIVASSDYIFTNRSLATDDNGLLAFRILECGEPLDVSFDESLNRSGAPKVLGLLFDPSVRPITLQVLIAAILFVWLGSRRFGPPLVTTAAEHRSITEHAVALGNLHFKAGTGARAVAWYLDYFRNELKLHYAAASGAQEATLLARRANMEQHVVARVLGEAGAVTREPRVSDARAASVLRALAGIKSNLDRAKGSAASA